MKIGGRGGVVLGVLAGLILVVGALVAFRPFEGSAEPASRSDDSVRAAWEGLAQRGQEELRSGPHRIHWPYSALRGQSRHMSAQMREGAMRTLAKAQSLRLRFDRARFAATPVGVGIWLVPGKGVICIVEDVKPATSCNSTADVARGGLWLEVYALNARHEPTHFLVLGIAPDGVDAVRATIGQTSVSIPVVDNIFARRAEAPITIRSMHSVHG